MRASLIVAAFGLLLPFTAYASDLLASVPEPIKPQVAAIYSIASANHCNIVSDKDAQTMINNVATEMEIKLVDMGASSESSSTFKQYYGEFALGLADGMYHDHSKTVCKVLRKNIDILQHIEADYMGPAL